MNWYYVQAGRQAGPVSEAELATLVSSGVVTLDTLVWREGMTNWQPYSQVGPAATSALDRTAGTAPGAIGSSTVTPGVLPPEVICSECRTSVARDNAIQYGSIWVCANCKPMFVQRLREGATSPTAYGTMVYGGFWIRFLARVLDGLILSAVGTMVSVVAGLMVKPASQEGTLALQGLLVAFSFALEMTYHAWFVVKHGATPGKMALRLKVVTAEGLPVSWGRAFGRYFATILSGCILMIGYIIAAFDDEKRALHDRICNTRVIKT